MKIISFILSVTALLVISSVSYSTTPSPTYFDTSVYDIPVIFETQQSGHHLQIIQPLTREESYPLGDYYISHDLDKT